MNILVVVAHPDDPEFFAGGALARWCAEGHHVRYVIVTGGDKGTDDPSMTLHRLVEMREAEQKNAAAVLGVKDVVFLHYVDGELANTLALQKDIAREVRKFKADIIVTTDHETVHYGASRINHNDHRMIGIAVCDALFPAANNRMYFPQLLLQGHEMHYPKEVYFAGAAAPNTLVDVTDFIDKKIAAIRCHITQVKDMDGVAKRIKSGALRMMADGSVHYIENYRRVLL